MFDPTCESNNKNYSEDVTRERNDHILSHAHGTSLRNYKLEANLMLIELYKKRWLINTSHRWMVTKNVFGACPMFTDDWGCLDQTTFLWAVLNLEVARPFILNRD